MAYREHPHEARARPEGVRIEMQRPPEAAPRVPGASVLAGMIAGMAMASWATGYGAATGTEFWLPVKLVAATLYGPEAITGGVDAVFLGLTVHLAVSAFLGAIFALFGSWRPVRRDVLLFAGLAYGMGVWVVMTYAVLPFVNPTMSARVAFEPFNWFFQHLVFGAVLGLLTFVLERPRDVRPSSATPAPA